MTTALNLLSGGAAQGIVRQLAPAFEQAHGVRLQGSFGAVGAMKARAMAGEPLDVLVLTDSMVDDLVASGFLAPGRHDLGKVGTGVAVRKGAAHPDVGHRNVLRASLRGASVITCPDPAVATAGKIVMNCLEKLGIADEVKPRLRFFPNGNAAMNWLVSDAPAGAIGITQKTEILPIAGVSYVAPLPDEFQAKATYSACCAAGSAQMTLAQDFVNRLTSAAAKPMLAAAGFEI